MTLRKITIDKKVRTVIKIAIHKVNKLKLFNQARNRMFQFLKKTKQKVFHRIIKKSVKILQQNLLEYLNEYWIITFNKKPHWYVDWTKKTKPQGTLEFVMDKQMQSFLFSLPINLSDEGKWLLAVTSFEERNSLFNIAVENNSFSISMPGRWRTPNYSEDNNIDELKNLPKFKSEKDIVLHVEEVRKRGNKIKIGDKEYIFSDFDISKKK